MTGRWPWIAAAVLVVLAAGGQLLINGIGVGYDIYCYQQAGFFVRHGWSPYLEHPVRLNDACTGWAPSTYPPVWGLLMVPLSYLPFPLVWAVWTLALLVAAVALLRVVLAPWLSSLGVHRRGALIAASAVACVTGPVWASGMYGQVMLFLTLMAAIDGLVLAPRGSRAAGVLIGIAAAIKLTPALFILYWLCARQTKPALRAIATGAVVYGVAEAFLPGQLRFYLTHVLTQYGDRVGDPVGFANQSINGLIARGLSAPPPHLLTMATTLLVAGVGVLLARELSRAGDGREAFAVVGLTTVLASPISWAHHGTWALPAVAVLLGDGRDRGRRLAALGATVGLCFPFSLSRPFGSFLIDGYWTLLYLTLMLLLAQPALRAARAR